MITAIVHGIVLAFGLILPLGPQNSFVIAQGASQPSLVRTLPAVVAAGLCDTLLIGVAVFGVSVAVLEVPWLRLVLVGGGVVFLGIVGVLLWRNGGGGEEEAATGPFSARRQVAFAVSVSLLNPHAILDTVGVIGPNALAYAGTDRLAFALACVAVSWVYFLGLALLGRVASNIRGVRRWLSRGSAVIMWGTALYLASTLV